MHFAKVLCSCYPSWFGNPWRSACYKLWLKISLHSGYCLQRCGRSVHLKHIAKRFLFCLQRYPFEAVIIMKKSTRFWPNVRRLAKGMCSLGLSFIHFFKFIPIYCIPLKKGHLSYFVIRAEASLHRNQWINQEAGDGSWQCGDPWCRLSVHRETCIQGVNSSNLTMVSQGIAVKFWSPCEKFRQAEYNRLFHNPGNRFWRWGMFWHWYHLFAGASCTCLAESKSNFLGRSRDNHVSCY